MQADERLGVALSIVTVALFIVALTLFISSGGDAAFYAAVIAALAVGGFNAWSISRTGKKPGRTPSRRKTIRR